MYHGRSTKRRGIWLGQSYLVLWWCACYRTSWGTCLSGRPIDRHVTLPGRPIDRHVTLPGRPIDRYVTLSVPFQFNLAASSKAFSMPVTKKTIATELIRDKILPALIVRRPIGFLVIVCHCVKKQACWNWAAKVPWLPFLIVPSK